MTENTKGILAYIIPFVGLILLFTEKATSREIKVHYAQATILMVAEVILCVVAELVMGIIEINLKPIIGLGAIAISLIGAVKVYNSQEYNIPVITENALKIFAKQIDPEA